MRKIFKKRANLAITLVLYVFGIMVVSAIAVSVIGVTLYHLGVVSFDGGRPESAEMVSSVNFLPFLGLLVFSTVIGTALAALLSSRTLKPIRRIIAATQEVAGGNFDVRVDISGIGELEELSESFNKMTQELGGIETMRSDFVNNFSHEFKTPIVSIRGFAKLLKDPGLDDTERQEYIDIIIQESERLANLSTNTLTLTKLESLEIVTEKHDFRLDEQIRRVIALMEPKWSSKALTLNVNMKDVLYNGNEDLMEQIWVNLLDNAIKFSFKDGWIGIDLACVGDSVVFSIQDEGCGMDEETQAHIFDKFYQGDKSRKAEGNGIGLSLVNRIVELCGGSVEVRSEKGEGTIFTAVLPC